MSAMTRDWYAGEVSAGLDAGAADADGLKTVSHLQPASVDSLMTLPLVTKTRFATGGAVNDTMSLPPSPFAATAAEVTDQRSSPPSTFAWTGAVIRVHPPVRAPWPGVPQPSRSSPVGAP